MLTRALLLRQEGEWSKKTKQMRYKMLVQLFEMFPAHELVDSGFHDYIFDAIKSEPVSPPPAHDADWLCR